MGVIALVVVRKIQMRLAVEFVVEVEGRLHREIQAETLADQATLISCPAAIIIQMGHQQDAVELDRTVEIQPPRRIVKYWMSHPT